jgi:hypothetical protein
MSSFSSEEEAEQLKVCDHFFLTSMANTLEN